MSDEKKSTRAVLQEDGFYHLPDGTKMTEQEYRIYCRQHEGSAEELKESKGQKRVLLG